MKIDINLSWDRSKTKIKIDGIEMKQVQSLKINAADDEIPTIILKLIPDELNIIGDVKEVKNDA